MSASPTEPPRTARLRPPWRGVYAVTPDAPLADVLPRAEACLAAGVRLLQYRHKTASPADRRRAVDALLVVAARHGALLVVNDDWQLARDAGCPAVHIGADDGDVRRVRDAVGPELLIGVSCYADLARARAAAPFADSLAFGAVFASPTKPQAPTEALAVLSDARALGRPVVAIGGIGPANAARAIAAGADVVAVISALFAVPDSGAAAAALVRICDRAAIDAGR